MYKIVEKKKISPTITLLKLDVPEIAKKVQPGQFVIIRFNEEGERVPLTVNDFDRKKGTITIVFQEVGKSTKLLGSIGANQHIADVVGPLGKHTEIEKFGKVICIGGGVGTAVIYPITRALYQAGNEVIGIVGAAVSTLVTFLILLIVSSLKSRELSFDIDWRFIIKSVIASLAMGGAVFSLHPQGVGGLVIAIAIGAAVYFVVLILLRGFTRSEYALIRDIIRRPFR